MQELAFLRLNVGDKMKTVEEIQRKRLLSVLMNVERENHAHFTIVPDEDALVVRDAGLLQPYDGFDSLDMRSTKATDTMQLLASAAKAQGKEIVSSDGESFYTVEIAALRELVNKLYGKQMVTENEKENPHGKQTTWRTKINGEHAAFHAASPSDTTVSMEVKVLEPVRQASKELAAAHGMTAQQLMEHLLVDALNNSPKELEQGRKRLQEFKGSTAKVRRFAEREELARLRQLATPPHK